MRLMRKLKQALGALSPSCREAVRLQSEQMDHPLSWAQRIGLGLHLALCKWCRRYGTHIHFLRSASRHEPESSERPGGALTEEARERIRRRLEEARK